MPIHYSETAQELADGAVIHFHWARRYGPPWRPEYMEDLDLTEEDIERVRRFRDPFVASQYVASHLLLNRALRSALGDKFRPEQVQRDQLGKPFLPGHPVRFSLSRSSDCSVVALCRPHEVGVDLETRMDLAAAREVAQRVLDPRELTDWRSEAPSSQLDTFRALWCLKEAILKVSGEGLSRDPRELGLEVRPPSYAMVRFPEAFGRVEDWQLGRARIDEGFPPVYWALRY